MRKKDSNELQGHRGEENQGSRSRSIAIAGHSRGVVVWCNNKKDVLFENGMHNVRKRNEWQRE